VATTDPDSLFQGPVPLLYERFLVPLIFQPFADELAARVVALAPDRVLEIAAGTGVVTRALAARLPVQAALVATDLSESMLDVAQAQGTARAVTWRQADAMQLPFANGFFDVVACQFGAMFFPDKARAFAEVRRVLAPGGVFAFSVWDRIEDNTFTDVVVRAMAGLFPDDPPGFLEHIPHGYHDNSVIRRDLSAAGFGVDPTIDIVRLASRAGSAAEAAVALCQGTPMRNEIQARGGASVGMATEVAARALAARFGEGAIEGTIQALVVVATK
jgi:SAM-dependent methyltransferase